MSYVQIIDTFKYFKWIKEILLSVMYLKKTPQPKHDRDRVTFNYSKISFFKAQTPLLVKVTSPVEMYFRDNEYSFLFCMILIVSFNWSILKTQTSR